MTAIAGIAKDGNVWIGADSLSSWGDYLIRNTAVSKVFQEGPFLIGVCGYGRLIQILRYVGRKLDDPSLLYGHDKTPAIEFMSTVFAKTVREKVREFGSLHASHGTEDILGSFLVGFRGQLFRVDGDLCVTDFCDGLAATGSGDSYAYGSLATTEGTKLTPEQRIEKALQVAERFCGSVRGPFTILKGK